MVKNIEIIEAAIGQLGSKNWTMLRLMLQKFMEENTKMPVAKKDLSVWDFVKPGKINKKEDGYWVNCTVYMDDKKKVAFATDTHILCVSKSEYDSLGKAYNRIDKQGKKYNEPLAPLMLKYLLNLDEMIKRSTPITLCLEESIVKAAHESLTKQKMNDDQYPAGIKISEDEAAKVAFPPQRVPILLAVGTDGWVVSGNGQYLHDDGDTIVAICGTTELVRK